MELGLGKKRLLLVVLLLISILIDVVTGATDAEGNDGSYIRPELQKELRLTKAEKDALDKLKLVLPKEPAMPYLRMDLFQIRWLRENSLSVSRTVASLDKLIQIRRKNRVANFWKQDWSDLFPNSPFELEGEAKDGSPILTLSTSKFDLRKIMLQGKRERMYSYCVNVGFEALEKITGINRKHSNITQLMLIANFDTFSPITHACPQCLQFYLFLLDLFELFLPGFTSDIIILNVPSSFGVLLEVVKPALSEHSRKVLKILGTNKNKWKPYLDSKIDPAQLSWEFGGTRVGEED